MSHKVRYLGLSCSRSMIVNDFPDYITQGELHLYADDTTAFVIGDNPDDVTIKLNSL